MNLRRVSIIDAVDYIQCDNGDWMDADEVLAEIQKRDARIAELEKSLDININFRNEAQDRSNVLHFKLKQALQEIEDMKTIDPDVSIERFDNYCPRHDENGKWAFVRYTDAIDGGSRRRTTGVCFNAMCHSSSC